MFKPILYTGVGVGVVIAGVYFYRLSRAGKKIRRRINVQVHRLSSQGFTLKVTVTIQNLSDVNLRVQQPSVVVSYKGKVIGDTELAESSEVPKRISVEKGKQGSISILMNFEWVKILGSALSIILQKIQSKGKLPLEILVQTATKVNGFTKRDEETIKLNV